MSRTTNASTSRASITVEKSGISANKIPLYCAALSDVTCIPFIVSLRDKTIGNTKLFKQIKEIGERVSSKGV